MQIVSVKRLLMCPFKKNVDKKSCLCSVVKQEEISHKCDENVIVVIPI